MRQQTLDDGTWQRSCLFGDLVDEAGTDDQVTAYNTVRQLSVDFALTREPRRLLGVETDERRGEVPCGLLEN
jgi:hypothetical protein